MSKASQVKQFVVGDVNEGADFSRDYIDALIHKIALWFNSPECDRAYPNPLEAAREQVQQCLLAETNDGNPWRNCPPKFESRIRAKCGYDIENNRGIPSARVKNPKASRALNPEAQKAAKTLDAGNPVATSFDQEAYRAKVEQDIFAAFPELDNPAHRPNVRSLSGLYAQRETIDRELALGVKANQREGLLKSLKLIEEMADTTMKRLGIHPDQIRHKINQKTSATIADFVANVDEDADYRNLERIWALQLALQLWWMTEHHNGNRTGRQISDWECWHMTRSRPSEFTCRCGHKTVVVEGFEPKDLHALLVKEGVLVEEPVIPALIDRADLAGLNDYFAGDTSSDDTEEKPDDAE